jgi:hypothetical protein
MFHLWLPLKGSQTGSVFRCLPCLGDALLGATMLLVPPPQVIRVMVDMRESPSSRVALGSGLGWVMQSLGQI